MATPLDIFGADLKRWGYTSTGSGYTDQSGSGNDAVLPTGVTAPTPRQAVQNGLAMLLFDGTSYLTIDALASYFSGVNQPFAWFIVFKNSNTSTLGDLASLGSSSDNNNQLATLLRVNDALHHYETVRQDDAGHAVQPKAGTPDIAGHYGIVRCDGSSLYLIVDGVVLASPSLSTLEQFTVSRFTLAALRRAGILFRYKGYIGEDGLISRDTTTQELTDLKGYLDGKWAITNPPTPSANTLWYPHTIQPTPIAPATITVLGPVGGGNTKPTGGIVQLDTGRVAVLVSYDSGSGEVPAIAFSDDNGLNFFPLKVLSGIIGRPVGFTYLGGASLTLGTVDPATLVYTRWFSSSRAQTWGSPLVIPPPPEAQGAVWGLEGDNLVDRDANGIATRVGEVIWWYTPGNPWPNGPVHAMLHWSTDGMQTWNDPGEPAAWQWQYAWNNQTYQRGITEGTAIRAADGSIVAALRLDQPPSFIPLRDDQLEGLCISRSTDDGITWTPVLNQVIARSGRMHANFQRLKDDTLVVSYIVRNDVNPDLIDSWNLDSPPPLTSSRRGLRARLSYDHGVNWSDEIVLDAPEDYDLVGGWNSSCCGHVSGCVLSNGWMLTAYGWYPRELGSVTRLIRWHP